MHMKTATNMAGEWPGAEASLPARRRNIPVEAEKTLLPPSAAWLLGNFSTVLLDSAMAAVVDLYS